MRVICIDNKGECGGDDAPELSIGSQYVVTDSMKIGHITLYELSDFPAMYYDQLYFALTSGPCELEISEARCREEAEALDIEFAEILENA